MKLEVERTGGFVGRTVRWTLDVDGLDPDGQAEVSDLLTQAPDWPAGSGADRFSYRLTAGGAGVAPLEVRFAEPLAAPAQRLLELVRASAPHPSA